VAPAGGFFGFPFPFAKTERKYSDPYAAAVATRGPTGQTGAIGATPADFGHAPRGRLGQDGMVKPPYQLAAHVAEVHSRQGAGIISATGQPQFAGTGRKGRSIFWGTAA
jgi:hypothetical protein